MINILVFPIYLIKTEYFSINKINSKIKVIRFEWYSNCCDYRSYELYENH